MKKKKKPLVGQPSNLQRLGTENLQVTNCPECNAGLELIIAVNKGGKLVPEDLTRRKAKNKPQGYQMIARISETPVINPMSIVPKGSA